VKGSTINEAKRDSLFGIDSREFHIKGHRLDDREGSIFTTTDEDTSGDGLVVGVPLTDNTGKRHSATLVLPMSRVQTKGKKYHRLYLADERQYLALRHCKHGRTNWSNHPRRPGEYSFGTHLDHNPGSSSLQPP